MEDPAGAVHVRTSSQGPLHPAAETEPQYRFLRMRYATCMSLPVRVGGGFGGKQEMLTEDLCVLAALKTGRPVKWEFTREEQFTGRRQRAIR